MASCKTDFLCTLLHAYWLVKGCMAGLPNYLIILQGLSFCKTVKCKFVINIFIYAWTTQHLHANKSWSSQVVNSLSLAGFSRLPVVELSHKLLKDFTCLAQRTRNIHPQVFFLVHAQTILDRKCCAVSLLKFVSKRLVSKWLCFETTGFL